MQNDNWGIPVDFDVPAFLRAAKSYYIRMQAAWDKADIHDIHEFTTPEMFAEMKLQLQERGPGPNITDVVSLDAELLGIETLNNEYMASVKFSGMIRESEGAPAEPVCGSLEYDAPDFKRRWLGSGRHSAAVLKNGLTYAVIKPSDIKRGRFYFFRGMQILCFLPTKPVVIHRKITYRIRMSDRIPTTMLMGVIE